MFQLVLVRRRGSFSLPTLVKAPLTTHVLHSNRKKVLDFSYVEFYTNSVASTSYLTYPTALVLQALSRGHRYGFDIMDATGLPSGTVYPILRRLARQRLLRSDWQNLNDVDRDRPRRRYYELTAAGERVLAEAAERYKGLQSAFAVGSAGPPLAPENG
jgi:DNA-binding MarR family transcriptional regulator